MSEFITEIRITRSPRGEGDTAVLIAGASGAGVPTHFPGKSRGEEAEMAMRASLDKALVVIYASLNSMAAAREIPDGGQG